jgi:hypothetical protein
MAIMWEAPEKIEVGPSPIEVAWKMWLAETLTRASVRTAPRASETTSARVLPLKKVA